MKKTFLSLAFVLSISLAFGTETKPVTNKSITIEPNPKDKVASSEKKSENSKKVFGTPECYALSCKVVCTEVYGPDLTMEQSIDNWEYFEREECNKPNGN
jgi:hypothetical protein